MRRFLASLGSVVCTLAIASCGGGDDSGPASIAVTPNPVTVAQQQTSQLEVSVLDANGLLVSGISVAFTSVNPEVATVSNTGVVTGARAGTTTIRVKAADLTTMVPVTVTAVSNAIVVTPNPGVVAQGGTLQLNAVVNDLNGEPIPGAPLLFTSGAPGIATVSSSGLVTPVGPAGQAVITVQSGNLGTDVPVAVTQVPTTLDVVPNPGVMGRSGSLQLTVTVRDRVGAPITGVSSTFTSSNTAMATVSATGKVTGKGLVGSVTIHVTAATLAADVPISLLNVGSPAGVLDATVEVSPATYGIDVSPAGLIVVTGYTISQATLSNRTFTALYPYDGSFTYAPAIALSGTTAWISVLAGGTSEVNLSTGEVLGTVPGGYFMLRMSTNGSRMYGSTNGRLDVINTATRTVERTISTNSVGLSLVLNPVGSTVFVGGDGDIQEVNPATGGVRTITSLGNKNFAVSPDGQFLFLVTEYELGIKVVRVSDGALVTTIPVDCAGWGIAVSPDGLKLFDSCGPNLILVRTDTQEKQTLVLGGSLRRTAFSADGFTAVITNDNGNVYFIR